MAGGGAKRRPAAGGRGKGGAAPRVAPSLPAALAGVPPLAVAAAALVMVLAGAWVLTPAGRPAAAKTAAPAAPAARYASLSLVHDERATLPHNKSDFTQGLFYVDDVDLLVESTGLYGRSALKVVAPDTGADVGAMHILDPKLFGEGATPVEATREIYQLTWRERAMLVYKYTPSTDKGEEGQAPGIDIAYDRKVHFPPTFTTEGWGICNNGTHFFVTDGSQYLHVWSVSPLKEVQRLPVYRKVVNKGPNGEAKTAKRSVSRLNELECLPPMVDGQAHTDILANVWYSNDILRIDSTTGEIIDVWDLGPVAANHPKEHVLNGIAYSAAQRAVYVTGKEWANTYRFPLKIGEAA